MLTTQVMLIHNFGFSISRKFGPFKICLQIILCSSRNLKSILDKGMEKTTIDDKWKPFSQRSCAREYNNIFSRIESRYQTLLHLRDTWSEDRKCLYSRSGPSNHLAWHRGWFKTPLLGIYQYQTAGSCSHSSSNLIGNLKGPMVQMRDNFKEDPFNIYSS